MSKRDELKGRAEKLGLKFPANISDAKLEKKIAEAEKEGAGEQTSPQDSTASSSPKQAGDGSAPADNNQPGEGVKASAENGDPGARAGGNARPADPQADLVVEVRGPKQGRRRAGRRFGPELVTIPLTELSEAEKQALISDPVLSVSTVARANEG